MNELIEKLIFMEERDWHMVPSERCALLNVLQRLKPDVSIEIGTFRGGSLRPISRLSRRTYTFDVDPNQHRIRDLFPSVEFITGDSAETLPPLIKSLNASNDELNFVLIDGSHESAGVRADITYCLEYQPKKSPLVMLMHDSSNPKVREGILSANWANSPFVHVVNVDYVPGMLYDRADIAGQIWGGLGIAVLLPNPRDFDLVLERPYQASLDILTKHPSFRLG